MSDPPLSDIDFKNKMAMVWTTLKKIAKIIYGWIRKSPGIHPSYNL